MQIFSNLFFQRGNWENWCCVTACAHALRPEHCQVTMMTFETDTPQ